MCISAALKEEQNTSLILKATDGKLVPNLNHLHFKINHLHMSNINSPLIER